MLGNVDGNWKNEAQDAEPLVSTLVPSTNSNGFSHGCTGRARRQGGAPAPNLEAKREYAIFRQLLNCACPTGDLKSAEMYKFLYTHAAFSFWSALQLIRVIPILVLMW